MMNENLARRLVRIGWAVLALNSLWVFGWLLYFTWELAHYPTERIQAGIGELGLSPDSYFAINAAAMILWLVSFFAVSTLLFIRLPSDPMALFAAILLMAFAGIVTPLAPEILQPLRAAPLSFTIPFRINSYLAWPLAFPFAVLFPDGQFVPRWSRYGAVYGFVLAVFWTTFLTEFSTATGAFGVLVTLSVILSAGIILYSQVYRYRRHSTPTQRLQTKWMVYCLAVVLSLESVSQVAIQIMLTASSPRTSLTFELVSLWTSVSLALLPLAIGVAILRYRLWDIDFLIRRTLVYIPLTAILAGIFAASISIAQRFFVSLTGQQSDAATVLTTLIVVAAFEPVKSWLQRIVERRFKEAPDPTKILNAFGVQVKNELGVIDARRITRRLLDEAMTAFGTTGGAVFLDNGKDAKPLLTRGEWDGKPALSIPLESDGTRWGELSLGARKNGGDYGENERAALQATAKIVADAIANNDVLPDHPAN